MFFLVFSRDGLPTSRLSERHQVVSAIMGRPNDRLIASVHFSIHSSGTVWSALLKALASSTGVPLIVRAPSVAGWGQSLFAAYPCHQLLLHHMIRSHFVCMCRYVTRNLLPAKDRDGG